MNAYTFIIAFIFRVGASEEPDESYYDVGTVLFSPSDLKKDLWSLDELLLLRAREHFVDLIPPPNVLNTHNKNLAKAMLTYFTDTYKTVSKEAPNLEMDRVLTTALSDTIGGYMKMWALPVIKFSYYGGTVPQDDALQLFQFHNDIKQYLHTDGADWHNPNSNFMNSIPVNIAPLHQTQYRSAKDPCESLAYFEKTSSGLAIPVPNVNWDSESESMFVPLKNQSLISLNAPSASDTLFNYYNTAKDCLQTSSIEDHNDFEDRLQNWLVMEVIPHLNDEKLYPALRSVLTLVNKTRNLCDTVIDLYSINLTPNRTTSLIPIDLSSKKMMVITVIIILEIAWCIPTLCYLMCTKIKKKNSKNSKNNVYFFIEPKDKDNKKRLWPESTQCSRSNTTASAALHLKETESKEVNAKCSMRSAGLGRTPQTMSRIVETAFASNSVHSLGTCTRSNVACQQSGTKLDLFNCRTGRKTKKFAASVKNLMRTAIARNPLVGSSTEMYSSTNDKEPGSKTASFITVQELQPTKTVTILQNNDNGKMSNSVNYTDENHKVEIFNGNKKDRAAREYGRRTTADQCNCKKNPNKPAHFQVRSTEKASNNQRQSNEHFNSRKPNVPRPRINEKFSKTKPAMLNPDKPFLEITIDKPQREISVDINNPIMISKPSKIPKMFVTNIPTQTPCFVSQKGQTNRKSLIPQRKRQFTVDDIIIENIKPNKAMKLNVTL